MKGIEMKVANGVPVVVFHASDKASAIAIATYVGQLENIVQNPSLSKEEIRVAVADARDIRDRYVAWQEKNPEEVTYPGERKDPSPQA